MDGLCVCVRERERERERENGRAAEKVVRKGMLQGLRWGC